MKLRGWMLATSVIAAAAAPAALGQGGATVIFSDVAFPGLATTAAPNVAGRPIETIDRPVASPDGAMWAISLNIAGDSASDDIIVVWDGAQFLTLVQEGVTPTPRFQLVGPIDQDLSLNDAGQVAFTTMTDGPVNMNAVAARIDLGGTMMVAAREGDQLPGTPFLYGAAIDSVQIDNTGNVYFAADTTDNSDFDEYILRTADGVTGAILFQEGVTVPAGQAGGFTFPWDHFGAADFDVTSDGLHTLLRGDTENAMEFDQVLAYDNSVVVQERVTFNALFVSPPDQGSPIDAQFLADNGDWYALGENEDGQEWIVRNGQVLVRTSDELFPGAGEAWGDLASITADTNGNYVVTGSGDDSDTLRDGVLVLNGHRIIARENDPVDVDGNGAFDDDTRIAAFGAHDAIVTADGMLIAQVTTRGVAGELLVAFDLGLGGGLCACDVDDAGSAGHVDVFDLLAFLNLWFAGDPRADTDGSTGVDVFDLLSFLDCWFPASAGSPCN